MYKNNKTGVTGVHYDNHGQKYRATAHLNGKKIRLGSFSTISEAEAKLTAFKTQNKDFISSVQTTHAPTLDTSTLTLYFLLCALDFYSRPITTSLKSYYLSSLSSLGSPIPDAPQILSSYFDSLSPLDAKIMRAWLRGDSMQKLAKLFNYSKSQINRKIIQNLEPLYRNNFNFVIK